mmetsp:Transcript_39696/g.45365  ORF Transcript_39696/g.45365 Transcript_39696/m.45365 type:complete len:138 (+) Transcript_39696:289-702(+)
MSVLCSLGSCFILLGFFFFAFLLDFPIFSFGFILGTSNTFEDLINNDDGETKEEDQEPINGIMGTNTKDRGQGGDIQNDKMHKEGSRHGHEQPRIDPRWNGQERTILTHGIQGIEHFNGHQDRQRQRGSFHFPLREI